MERCAPPSAFFAVLGAAFAWFLTGYLFAPTGVLLVLLINLVPLAAGLDDAGRELERLITGLRAVDGSGFGDGL